MGYQGMQKRGAQSHVGEVEKGDQHETDELLFADWLLWYDNVLDEVMSTCIDWISG